MQASKDPRPQKSPKSRKVPKVQKEDYKRVFDLLDKDKDGIISSSELEEALRTMGLSHTQLQLKKLVDSVDSGTLDFAEFESLVTREVAQSSLSFAKKYFEMYDTDKDGIITVKELQDSLRAAGYSDEHIKDATEDLLDFADFDNDKKVSFEGKLNNQVYP